MTMSAPFARWGLDIIELFLPESRGRKYLFITVNFFMKWVESKAVRNIIEENINQFIFKNIICQFGVPLQIIMDNNMKFTSRKVQEFSEENRIIISFTLVYHPQANRQVEVTNQTIVGILKRKMGDNSKTWAYMIPKVMWAYQTTTKTGFGFSPFILAFKIEAVAPTEFIWPTTLIENYNKEGIEAALLTLKQDKVEEKRERKS